MAPYFIACDPLSLGCWWSYLSQKRIYWLEINLEVKEVVIWCKQALSSFQWYRIVSPIWNKMIRIKFWKFINWCCGFKSPWLRRNRVTKYINYSFMRFTIAGSVNFQFLVKYGQQIIYFLKIFIFKGYKLFWHRS